MVIVLKEYIEQGEYEPIKGLEYVKRDNVALITAFEDKFCVLQYNEVNYKSLITGGVEKGEDFELAVARELLEETGYFDIAKIVLVENGIHVAKFYVEHKHQNRLAFYYPYFVQLNSLENKDIAENESREHAHIWLTKDEVEQFGMFENHIMMFEEAVKVKKL